MTCKVDWLTNLSVNLSGNVVKRYARFWVGCWHRKCQSYFCRFDFWFQLKSRRNVCFKNWNTFSITNFINYCKRFMGWPTKAILTLEAGSSFFTTNQRSTPLECFNSIRLSPRSCLTISRDLFETCRSREKINQNRFRSFKLKTTLLHLNSRFY